MADLPDIKFPCAIFDISFHPLQDLVCTGLVSGRLDLHQYGDGAVKRVLTSQLHSDSIRSIAFSADGQRLYTGSRDKSIKCVDPSGTVVWQCPAAHSSSVNVVLPFGGHMLASGDDDGKINVWDMRGAPKAATSSWVFHEDLINALLVEEDRSTMLSASGDGTLGVLDFRKQNKLVARTEQEEDELLSLAIVKGGGAVVAGTQDGVLLTWKWGKWIFDERSEEDGPARFTGHPESIDALLPVDDDAIVTGSSDGIIRLVTVQPNKLVGVLGEHGEDPIERLAWSRDRRFIASAGHDEMVKFWNVEYLFEDDDDDDEAGGVDDAAMSESAAASSSAGAAAAAGGSGKRGGGGSRFASLPALAMPRTTRGKGNEDDDEDEDDDDDDDEEDDSDDESDDDDGADASMKGTKKPVAKGTGKLKNSRRPPSGGAGGKAPPQRGKGGFFDDL